MLLGLGTFILIFPLAVVLTAPATSAATGRPLRTLTPQDSGNGRALAHDPVTGRLFYTNADDPHIYVIRPDGSWVATLSPQVSGTPAPIVYGALSWQATPSGGVLWGGRFDGSGAVDRIDPATGRVTPAFSFPFPAGQSCYAEAPGFIDGLAFDQRTSTLWLGDDNATSFYQVSTSGQVLGQYAVPAGRCRTGIASDGKFLWLGLQSGPDTAPYSLVRVNKADTTVVLQSFDFGASSGPEGIALDNASFGGKCALWSNQFGSSTILKAWQLPTGLCASLPRFKPLTAPSLRSVGLLTFQYPKDGQLVVNGCVATVVDSANLSTIVTAAHCLSDAGSFPGAHTNLQFAPAHTGACWDNINAADPHQVEVSPCGGNPYGVWFASGADVHLQQGYDIAFVTVHPGERGGRTVQSAVGGLPITYDFATDPATDPLQSRAWIITSYASDDINFAKYVGFGPWECLWNGAPPSLFGATGASALRLTAILDHACSFVDPLTGAQRAFSYTQDAFGDSGSPWTTPGSKPSIGAIHGGDAHNPSNCSPLGSDCFAFAQGTKLNAVAQQLLNAAQTASP